ncbi:hypothetical protein Aperf_G00000090639 [Anoplocephala perfoliata]
MFEECNSQNNSFSFHQCKTIIAAVWAFFHFSGEIILCVYLYLKLFLIPLAQIVYTQSLQSIQYPFCFFLALIYSFYWIISRDWPNQGGIYSPWYRGLTIYRWAMEYFPSKLVVSDEMIAWGKRFGSVLERNGQASVYLPKDINYLVGYHPHGIFPIAAMGGYGSNSMNFFQMFPGIRPHVATLHFQFRIPIHRDLCMLGGKRVFLNREAGTL